MIAGAVLAGRLLFQKVTPTIDPSVLATIALVLLLMQALFGFPLDRTAKRAMKDQEKESRASMGLERDEVSREMSREMSRAMSTSMSIKTERNGAFYLVLLALAIPAGMLIYSMLPTPAMASPGGASPTPTPPPSTRSAPPTARRTPPRGSA